MTVADLARPADVALARALPRLHGGAHLPERARLDREDEAADLVAGLRALARRDGLWAPHLPPEAGGTGSGFLDYAYLNEEIGRSIVGASTSSTARRPTPATARSCGIFGTDEQKERFLRPLVEGRARSFFSMTEPEVSGSDPTTLRTRAVRDGDDWVINGHKWFSSSAEGAAFGIVMAVTDPDADPHRARRRSSCRPTPRRRDRPRRSRSWVTRATAGRRTARCATRTSACRSTNTLGEQGDGFRIAQKRLGPGRIHHVMRWLGQMQRAFELMCSYSLERETFGGPLADKQTVQNWIADSAAEIQACRLMTLDAAHKIDQGDEARVEVSLIKFYAARVLNEVDRSRGAGARRARADGRDAARRHGEQARAARIYDGPDEVHRMVVARRILKSYAEGDGWRFD